MVVMVDKIKKYGNPVSDKDLYYRYNISSEGIQCGAPLAWDYNNGLNVILSGSDDQAPCLIIQENPKGDSLDWSCVKV